MLKIGKGLKKKKKSKKNKHKEVELFTEEELEKYKKEHSQKLEENQGENSEGQQNKTSEEFEKFKLLTAGVDDILRKSQGDLDRIKKESFFQRKLTPSELKAQEDKEKEELKRTQGKWTNFEDNYQTERNKEQKEDDDESESEYEYDDKDNIFDTTYVEAVESGKIKLVYVPEDDEIVKEGELDPFDTSTAEKILKKVEEEEEKKKQQISLSLAVQVLTGRADRDKLILEEFGSSEVLDSTSAPKPKKRPRKIQDVVLIGSFEEEKTLEHLPGESVKEIEIVKSLLDDDLNVECELPEGNALITKITKLSANKHSNNQDYKNYHENKKSSESLYLKDLVNEFDVINEEFTPEIKKAEEVQDEFDEFTALAASSVVNQKLEEELQKFQDSKDDPFDTSSANLILKEQGDPFGNIDPKVPLPEITKLSFQNCKWSAFPIDQAEEKIEVDPFDTSFAEKIQPGKCELKLLENEILGDLVESAHKSDIHQEARILSRNNSDSDFNPRAEETSFKLNNQNFYSKVSIHITDPSGTVKIKRSSESENKEEGLVSLSFKHRDLLGGSTTDLTKLGNDPLPPEAETPLENFSKYSDPFDTSIVDQVVIPGKAELKFLENELLSDIKKNSDEDNLSDIDFDPRKEETSRPKVSFDVSSILASHLLSTKEDTRPLTPFYAETTDDSDINDLDDPFDTTHVSSLPGKEELKIIEKELNNIHIGKIVSEPIYKKLGIVEDLKQSCPGLKHSLSDQDFNPRVEETDQNKKILSNSIRRFSEIEGLPKKPPSSLNFNFENPDLLTVGEEHFIKALTPAIEEDISNYTDPFDTSIADNIVPGKAELKILESELITNPAKEEIKRSYTDPDFNPREPSEKEGPPLTDILSFTEDSINIKPLTPVDIEADNDIDPFDTSTVTNLLPGKAEIRVLESELFG